MREAITVTGMVLAATPVGDYDKRMVILTRERGKITVFARGARKSTSQFLAIANPFVFGSFQIYEGRTAYNLVQANIREYFTELASRQPGVYYGFYFLEIADYFGREGSGETAMLNLLYVTMKALLNEKLPDPLIRTIFEMKAMVINGEYPQMFGCVSCGKEKDLDYVSISQAGAVCRSCVGTVKDAVSLSPTALYTLQYIIASPIEKLYTFIVKPEIVRETGRWMHRYMERYTDRKFRSLEILEMVAEE